MFNLKREKESKRLQAAKEVIMVSMPTLDERKQWMISRIKEGITIDEVKAYNALHKDKADYVDGNDYTEEEVLNIELLNFCDQYPGTITHDEYNELHHFLAQKEIDKKDEKTNLLVKRMLHLK